MHIHEPQTKILNSEHLNKQARNKQQTNDINKADQQNRILNINKMKIWKGATTYIAYES